MDETTKFVLINNFYFLSHCDVLSVFNMLLSDYSYATALKIIVLPKAVVGGLAMARTLSLPEMALAGPHFGQICFFAGLLSPVSSRTSLMIYFSIIKDLLFNDNYCMSWSIFRLPQGVKDSFCG